MNTANLRRLLDEATPRPWKVGEAYNGVVLIERVNPDAVAMACVADCYGIDAHIDAAMIVELVNNAAELLAFQEKGRVVRECVKCGRGYIHMTSSEQAVMQDALFASAEEQKP